MKPGERKQSKELASSFFKVIKDKQLLWLPPDPSTAKKEYDLLSSTNKRPEWHVSENNGRIVVDSPVKAIRRTNKEEFVLDLIEWAIDLKIFDGLKLAGDRKYCTLSAHLGFLASTIASEKRRGVFQLNDVKPNPFVLTMREKLFFLYVVLYSDSWFYSSFIRHLAIMGAFRKSFGGRPEGVDAYKESWQELVTFLRETKSNTLLSAAKEIAGTMKGLQDESCYQRVKNKLEILYDLELLNKQHVDRFEYTLNERIEVLARELPELSSLVTQQRDPQQFLKESFFKLAAQVYNIEISNPSVPRSSIESTIIKNYRLCMSGIVARMENIEFLSCLDVLESGKVLEMTDIHKIILDWNVDNPKAVSLHVDQFGVPRFVRMEKTFIDQKVSEAQ